MQATKILFCNSKLQEEPDTATFPSASTPRLAYHRLLLPTSQEAHAQYLKLYPKKVQ